jgi:hypothetical protein
VHTVKVELEEDIFGLLQSLAKPFVDTPSSVIRGMWEELQKYRGSPVKGTRTPPTALPASKANVGTYTTSRGVQIPFGELRAVYKRRGSHESKTFKAKVNEKGIEFAGQIFDDPSPAGIHAKQLAGARGPATSTNGWEFWEYYNTAQSRWLQIGTLRSPKGGKLTLKDLDL